MRKLFIAFAAAVAFFVLLTGLAAGSEPMPGEGPSAETVGSPIGTARSLRLEARVNPQGSPTTYHFEYGTQGPCHANPCIATAEQDAGAGQLVRFVSQPLERLTPGTTYHYRVVAVSDNGLARSSGQDMTAATRLSDAPLTAGARPGPPASDRGWEQVNMADTGGNPVIGGYAFSDDGDRAVYQVLGGTSISDTGSAYNQLFAKRTPGGWQSQGILPPRDEAVGPNWRPPYADAGLSRLISLNEDFSDGQKAFWRLVPDGPAIKLAEAREADYGGFYVASDDLSRTVVALRGTVDPTHPVPAGAVNLYDIGAAPPQLLSLLPSGDAATCGVAASDGFFDLPRGSARRASHWLSSDGSLLFFPSRGDGCDEEPQLYVRNIPAATTTRVSAAPVSGPACGAGFVKATPDAVFFWSESRLLPVDSAPADCTGGPDGDVYRYRILSGGLDCVTCLQTGIEADVDQGSQPAASVAVAEDGSRVYFSSHRRLIAGADSPGAYRIEVSTADLAYVGPLGSGSAGDILADGNALTPDGSVLVFRSSAAGLNQLSGAQNGGTDQYYRYDDQNRSLTCVSCPPDGTPAGAAAVRALASPLGGEIGRNADPLSDDGDFVFSTPNPLLPVDRNTPPSGGDPSGGIDLYEWRDGQVLIVSDGITTWPSGTVAPVPSGVSPSGRDVFFTVSARYTPDAPDAYSRLYDARIGGGFEFPGPTLPCSLESCPADPIGELTDGPLPQSDAFHGSGNVKSKPRRKHLRCRRGRRKVRHHGKVVCRKIQGGSKGTR